MGLFSKMLGGVSAAANQQANQVLDLRAKKSLADHQNNLDMFTEKLRASNNMALEGQRHSNNMLHGQQQNEASAKQTRIREQGANTRAANEINYMSERDGIAKFDAEVGQLNDTFEDALIALSEEGGDRKATLQRENDLEANYIRRLTQLGGNELASKSTFSGLFKWADEQVKLAQSSPKEEPQPSPVAEPERPGMTPGQKSQPQLTDKKGNGMGGAIKNWGSF